MEKKTIGTFLSALRKASGLTQKQLAEKLNVSDKAVSRWERDECAPDLTLIPVLAEIYGITSDEILRGQRCNPDAAPKEIDSVKAEKQRRHLLSRTMSKFCVHSIISTAIVIIGLIIVGICNFEFGEAAIGFWFGAAFFAAAILAQIIFGITDFASILDDDWSAVTLTNNQGTILFVSETIVSVFCILFAVTLPLAKSSHKTVSLFTCVNEGLIYVLVAAIICAAICLIINLIFCKRFPAYRNRLRMICAGTLALLVIVLLVGQVFLNNSLMTDRHLYAPCDKYKTLKSFKYNIEQKVAPDGSEMYKDGSDFNGRQYVFSTYYSGEKIVLTKADVQKQLISKEIPTGYYNGDRFIAEYGYEFEHLNRYIVYYELSDSDGLVPIYTFNVDQLKVADQIALGRLIQYSLLYLIPIAIITAVYLILRRKHP